MESVNFHLIHGNFKILLWQNGPLTLMAHLALHKSLSNQMLSKNKPELTVPIKKYVK